MRRVVVFYKKEKAGILSQLDDGSFQFEYFNEWIENTSKPSISVTLPKKNRKFTSKEIFPFFYHLLPEGNNKKIVCQSLKIDENDEFGILLNTAQYDTIGAVTIAKLKDEI